MRDLIRSWGVHCAFSSEVFVKLVLTCYIHGLLLPKTIWSTYMWFLDVSSLTCENEITTCSCCFVFIFIFHHLFFLIVPKWHGFMGSNIFIWKIKSILSIFFSNANILKWTLNYNFNINILKWTLNYNFKNIDLNDVINLKDFFIYIIDHKNLRSNIYKNNKY